VVVQVKALACELPAARGLPLSRLSTADVAEEARRCGLVATISDTTVWRWLHEDAIRPWQHRCWIFPRDPHFAEKAGRILDLYAGQWDGQPLQEDEFVLSADEKTSIQARLRKHGSLPPRPGEAAKVEHEYTRGGAWAYLAALDVHRAKLFGRESTTGIAPFERLIDQVMTQPPYREARRVFWIIDNGSSHRGDRCPPPRCQVPAARARAQPRACQLAQSDRDLLLDRPTQGAYPQRLLVAPGGGRPPPALSNAL